MDDDLKRAVDWVKSHPAYAAGGVGVVVLALLYARHKAAQNAAASTAGATTDQGAAADSAYSIPSQDYSSGGSDDGADGADGATGAPGPSGPGVGSLTKRLKALTKDVTKDQKTIKGLTTTQKKLEKELAKEAKQKQHKKPTKGGAGTSKHGHKPTPKHPAAPPKKQPVKHPVSGRRPTTGKTIGGKHRIQGLAA